MMLKIGVLGAGHLGKIHLRLAKEIPAYEVAGFYDSDAGVSEAVEKELGIKAFPSAEALITSVDVVDIVTPTLTHFEYTKKALKSFRHVFVEKPVTQTPEEAKALISMAREAGVKVQVGHVERFNPAFIASRNYFNQPMFIESHRLAQFNPRGTDVSVVLDLMIHDIDIVLSVVKSAVKKISASGVSVVSDSPDIANARIEFDNGCVANLTSSRISLKNMRKTRFFQKDAYISVDFLDRKVEVIRLMDVKSEPDPLAVIIDAGKNKGLKQIYFDNPKINETNAIKDELVSFADSILNNTEPIVGIQQAHEALDIACRVIEKMNPEGTQKPEHRSTA